MDQNDFDRFLAWLAPDRDAAARRYEEIRRRLIKIAEMRRFAEPEAIADEVIDRVIRKVSEIADDYVGDPAFYFYGVARNVMHEWERRIRPSPSLPVPPPDPWEEKEPRYACLDSCMNQLKPDDRQLLLDYYTDEGREKIERRRELAETRGFSENAMRIRLSRLRTLLRICINGCLQASGG